jgi:hypothetical protein
MPIFVTSVYEAGRQVLSFPHRVDGPEGVIVEIGKKIVAKRVKHGAAIGIFALGADHALITGVAGDVVARYMARVGRTAPVRRMEESAF